MYRTVLYIQVALVAFAGVCLAQSPDLSELRKQAQAAFDAKDTYKAEELYKQILAADKADANAYLALGRIYRWQRRNLDAFEMLNKAVELEPQNGLANAFLGLHHAGQAGLPQAVLGIPYLKKAIGLLPPDTVAGGNVPLACHMEIGRIEEWRNDLAAAREIYAAAHGKYPTSPGPIRRLATLELEIGNLSDARTSFEKLLALRPDDKDLTEQIEKLKTMQEVKRIELVLLHERLEIGARLPAGAITFRGYDDRNRIVNFDRHWEVSSGLTLVSTEPLVVEAKDKPSEEEYVYLTDKASGTFAKAAVSVIGAPVKLAVVPERLGRQPGERATIRLSGVDVAGNAFPANKDKVAWQVQKGGAAVPGFTVTHDGDDRYHVECPATTPLDSYTVIATLGELRVVAQLDLVAFDKPAAGPAWKLDLASARADAKASSKPMVVFLWTTDSPLCDRMLFETFNQKQIADDLSLFVPVRVNAANAPELGVLYGVKVIPTILILSPSGAYVNRHVDFIKAEDLHTRLVADLKAAGELDQEHAKLSGEAAAPAATATSWQVLGNAYRKAYLNGAAAAAYRKALGCADVPKAQAGQLKLALAHLMMGDRNYPEMEALVDAVIANASEAEIEAQAMFYKGYCLFYGRAQEEAAKGIWLEVTKKHGKSTWAKRAKAKVEELFGRGANAGTSGSGSGSGSGTGSDAGSGS